MTFPKPFPLLFISIVGLVFSGCSKQAVQAARDDNSTSAQEILQMDDKEFLLNADEALIRQETFAKLALDKSQSENVRAFAQRIVTEADRDLSKLHALMQVKGIPEPASLVEGVQLDAANRLRHKSGTAFDDEFISLMTADEQDAMRRFDRASYTASDPDVRNFAATVLPWLRQNYDIAAGLEEQQKSH